MSSQKVVLLNNPELTSQANALQSACNELSKIETKYKNKMDNMAGDWWGESGKSFAEAAGRVEAGYTVNRTVLEQMIYDVKESQKTITERDTTIGKSLAAM